MNGNENIYAKLCDYYDTFLSKSCPLFVKHFYDKPFVLVTFNDSGLLKIEKTSEEHVFIPCSSSSATRSGTSPVSHPVSDKYKYIFSESHRDAYLSGLNNFVSSLTKYKSEYCKLVDFISDLFNDVNKFNRFSNEFHNVTPKDDAFILFRYVGQDSIKGDLYNDMESCFEWDSWHIEENRKTNGSGECFLTGKSNVVLGTKGNFPKVDTTGAKLFSTNTPDLIYDNEMFTQYGLAESMKIAIALDFLMRNANVDDKKNKYFLNRIDNGHDEYLLTFPEFVDDETLLKFKSFPSSKQMDFNRNENSNPSVTIVSTLESAVSYEKIDKVLAKKCKVHCLTLKKTQDGYHLTITSHYSINGSKILENYIAFKRNFTYNGNPVEFWRLGFKSRNDKFDALNSIFNGLPLKKVHINNVISRDNKVSRMGEIISAIDNYNQTKMNNNTMATIDRKYGELFECLLLIEESYNFYKNGRKNDTSNVENYIKEFKRNPIVFAEKLRLKNNFKIAFLTKINRTLPIEMYNQCFCELSNMNDTNGRVTNDKEFILGEFGKMNEFRKTIEELKKNDSENK